MSEKNERITNVIEAANRLKGAALIEFNRNPGAAVLVRAEALRPLGMSEDIEMGINEEGICFFGFQRLHASQNGNEQRWFDFTIPFNLLPCV